VIKTELSEKPNGQLFSFKDKKIVREIPIYRRHLVSSQVSSTSAPKDKEAKRLSLTETSTPAEKPKTSRVLCISGMLHQGSIDKSSSIKQYRSLRVAESKEGTKKLDRHMKLALRREINENYRKPFNPPPKITAKSYIVY
jgi:hypothetical protein